MLKRILFIILSVSLVFAIASCGGSKGCNTCTDENGDGICDVCDNAMPEEEIADVLLIEDGYPTFQIVMAPNMSSAVRQTINSTLKSDIENAYGIAPDSFIENREGDEEIDVEVLIGNVTSRGEKHFFDGHSLGKEGYAIKIIGSKIIVNGGSEETLIRAIEEFSEFLVDREDYEKVVMTKEDTVLVVQDDYKIDSLKVNGNDMRGYTFAVDLTRKYYKDTAEAVQDAIYDKTGYWFNIVDVENATDKSIIMKHVDGVTGDESFKVYTNGTQLVIECAFDNSLEKSVFKFTTQHITTARGDVDFKKTVFNEDISVVYYDDFGAKGDGETDDFHAIRAAHIFANECGQTVKASRDPEGKVYYIYDTRTDPENNSSVVSIPIRTNTDWQNVKFIIDDKNIVSFTVSKTDPLRQDPNFRESDYERNYALSLQHIFEILPEKEHEAFKFKDERVLSAIVADGLNPDTKKINLKIDGWDGDLMIVPYNSEHGVFRRKGAYGTLQSAGEDMHELIVIDKDGNVSPETPIMFEYTNIDYITVYKLDPKTAITVGNATIETVESRVRNKRFDTVTGKNLFDTSTIKRGINVMRSYTVVENVNHELSGGYTLKERANGFESCNYQGMFRANEANHVTFRNCQMQGRQKYDGHSSYDFGAELVNKIVLEGCTQINFWVTVDPHEGVMRGYKDYVDGAYTSMSTVGIYNNEGELVQVGMCWGIGGTNYCKNMEYINSQLSRFDAHAGLYNGKIINSTINAMELTGYGELVIENTDWYQPSATQEFFALRSDYGFLWNGTLSAKNTRLYLYDTTEEIPSLAIVGHAYSNFYFGYPTCFPSVTLDNVDVYSTKNQAPVDTGYTINLYNMRSEDIRMHLEGDAGKAAIFTYLDEDKDGYIDEPLFDINMDGRINDADRVDFDGDGKVGNTSLKYADYADKDIKDLNKGIKHPECVRNLNVVKPPEYIKIINNDGVNGSGGYTYNIVNTGGVGISDGGWYRDKDAPDTFGGFFGGTKFIYGEGPNDYFLGSDHEDQTETTTFKFFN